MTYTLPHVREAPLVAVEGQIDPPKILELQRWIKAVLDGGHRRVVVDLSAVTDMALPNLSLFCAALRRVNHRGAKLAIAGALPHVARTVELCAIDGVELHPSVNAALVSSTSAAPTDGAPHPGVSATKERTRQHV